MARKLPLTLACGDYEFLRPLGDGRVEPEGIALTVLFIEDVERHRRMLRHREFDVAELSMSSYLMVRDQGLPFVALPVFPHRRFPHRRFTYINAAAGIRHPRDLEDKRVGLRTFQTTAALWCRGILQEHYGVNLRAIRWYTEGEEDIPFQPAPGFSVERLPQGSSVDRMLEAGELEGVLYTAELPSFRRGSPKVKYLFDEPRQEENAYYQKTGFMPIMHIMALKEEVVEAHPWMAMSLYKAFEQAKAAGYRRLRDVRVLPLAWVMQEQSEQERLLGPDPYAYGLDERNRKNLEALIGYSLDHGLIRRRIPVAELFAPSTLERLPR